MEYAGQDVFSVRVAGEYSCNGPGPAKNRRDDSMTLDLKTGDAILTIDELFKKGTSWPEAFAVLFRYQQTEAAKPGGDACLRKYTPKALEPALVAFHFSKDGLVVGPALYGPLSRVHECEQQTVVPYSVLKPLADAASALGRVVAATPPDAPTRYRIWDWYVDAEHVFDPPRDPKRD